MTWKAYTEAVNARKNAEEERLKARARKLTR